MNNNKFFSVDTLHSRGSKEHFNSVTPHHRVVWSGF